jgi:hypothetical protein
LRLLFTVGRGPNRKLSYSQLDNEDPDIPLKTLERTDTKLHDSLGEKVSLVFIWLACSQPDIAAVSGETGASLQFMDNAYHSFGLGEAKPGVEEVENATPEPEPAKKH